MVKPAKRGKEVQATTLQVNAASNLPIKTNEGVNRVSVPSFTMGDFAVSPANIRADESASKRVLQSTILICMG